MSPVRRGARTLPAARQAAVAPASANGHQLDTERLAAIGRVAAGVAHDFNNILTVIALGTQLLESQGQLDGTGREQLRLIRREVDRGSALIWQILDFAHRGPITLEPVDLDTFFADLLPVLRRVQSPDVEVTFVADGGAHRVMGDAARLEQCIVNLANNAADAIAGRGRIDVGLEALTGAPAAGAAEGPWVRITFADTGAGIPPEVLPRIFEPFFSTKPHGRGTGLGLAQVRGLVAQHGGHVRVASAPGQGTAVEIWLPAATAVTAPAGP